jgi:hypothetical protein
MNRNLHMTYMHTLSKKSALGVFGFALIVFTAIALGIFGGGFVALDAKATNSWTYFEPTCDLEQKEGRTIVSFNEGSGFPRLRSDRPFALEASVTASVPAGVYTVTTQSFDGYTNRNKSDPNDQDKEQWNLILSSNSSELGTFGPTTDITDGVDEDTKTDVVATDVSFADEITKITARHAFPNTDKPHSVLPVCVAFDKVVDVYVPQCPIAPREGWTIVELTTDFIRSDTKENASKRGPFALSLSAGTYEVELASYDDHSSKPYQTQPNEKWFLQLRSLLGDTVAETGVISDLPNDKDYLIETVNTELVLSSNVKNALARHAVYPDKTNPNSIVPLCAAFKKKQEEPKAPVCTLSIDKNEITKGEAVELTWTSENTVSASIDKGIGSVSTDGATTTKPIVDTMYTVSFVGENDETITCEVSVVVREEPDTPQCPITPGQNEILVDLSTGMIRSDKSVSLAQKGPFTASIPKGNYAVTLASYDDHSSKPYNTQPKEQWFLQLRTLLGDIITSTGVISDLPNDKNYLTEVVDAEIAIAEDVKNVIAQHFAYLDTDSPNSIVPLCALFKPIPDVEVVPPVCTISATPSELSNVGDGVELQWTSERTVSASIDNNIGSVGTSGATTTYPVMNTTYTASFIGENGDTISCSAPVTLPVDVPMCELKIGPVSVIAGSGEEVTLSWNTDNITAGEIDNGVGSVGTSGSMSFIPNADTLYTGTFWGEYGTTTCSARVTVTVQSCTNCGGGGGGSDPRVVLSKLDVPNESPLAFVYLSQVPYTGFPASPLVTGLYWFSLIAISFIIAFLLISKGVVTRMFAVVTGSQGFKTKGGNGREQYDMKDVDTRFDVRDDDSSLSSPFRERTFAPAPVNLPTGGMISAQSATSHARNTELAGDLEARAQAQGVLISPEGLDLIISFDEGDDKVLAILARILEGAKGHYPREDGWILLNKERIHALRVAGDITTSAIDERQAVSVGEVLSSSKHATMHVSTSPKNLADVPQMNSISNSQDAFKATEQTIRTDSASNTWPHRMSKNVSNNHEDTSVSVVGNQYEKRNDQTRIRSELNTSAYSSQTPSKGGAVGDAQSKSTDTHSATFVRWLMEGSENNVFDFLRSLASRGGSSSTFLSHVVSCLDDAYRFRVEGGQRPDKQVAEIVSGLANHELEHLLEILAGGIDHSYSSAQTGAKVVSAKAMDYLRGVKG